MHESIVKKRLLNPRAVNPSMGLHPLRMADKTQGLIWKGGSYNKFHLAKFKLAHIAAMRIIYIHVHIVSYCGCTRIVILYA